MTWLIDVRHASFTRTMWFINICDVGYSYVWHAAMRCDMTHWCASCCHPTTKIYAGLILAKHAAHQCAASFARTDPLKSKETYKRDLHTSKETNTKDQQIPKETNRKDPQTAKDAAHQRRLFTCLTWLIDVLMSIMSHSHAQHDSFISATWLTHIYDMTHS